jgi:hypothetical protein
MKVPDRISIPRKELVEEHVHLVKTLKSGSKKRRMQEYQKQKKELKEYRGHKY